MSETWSGARPVAPDPVRVEVADRLRVEVHADRRAMGQAAAARVVERLGQALARRDQARLMLASAPSQLEFLDRLAAAPLAWGRIEAFHMDEYLGLDTRAPQSFAEFLRRQLFGAVRPHAFHVLDGMPDPGAEAAHYTALLRAAPLDVVCCGIGENGHLAFNDPEVADFEDPTTVKEVVLSPESRRQQVHDGMFPTLEVVPTRALTVTLPTLFGAAAISCVVPGPTKRTALQRTLHGPIGEDCPATLLRRHPDCVLFTDPDAYGER